MLATVQVCSHFVIVAGEIIAYGVSTNFQANVGTAMRNFGGEFIWLILQCVCVIILGTFGYLLFDLFKFHITLIRYDDTTYNYFKARDRRDRIRKVMKRRKRHDVGKAGTSTDGAVFPAEFDPLEVNALQKGTVCAALCFFCCPIGAPNKLPKWVAPHKNREIDVADGEEIVERIVEIKCKEAEEKMTMTDQKKKKQEIQTNNPKEEQNRAPMRTLDGSSRVCDRGIGGIGAANIPSPVTVEFQQEKSIKNERGRLLSLSLEGRIVSERPRKEDGMIEMVLDWTLANNKHAIVYSCEIEVLGKN
jgi:hypothetical protein